MGAREDEAYLCPAARAVYAAVHFPLIPGLLSTSQPAAWTLSEHGLTATGIITGRGSAVTGYHDRNVRQAVVCPSHDATAPRRAMALRPGVTGILRLKVKGC